MVTSELIYNPTNATVESEVSLSQSQERVEETNWAHQFGVGLSTTYTAKANFAIVESEFSMTLDLNYDYTTGQCKR